MSRLIALLLSGRKVEIDVKTWANRPRSSYTAVDTPEAFVAAVSRLGYAPGPLASGDNWYPVVEPSPYVVAARAIASFHVETEEA